ncbi:MAG: helix-turn-helix domain-containing protein, partial [Actinomycetota bacterium]
MSGELSSLGARAAIHSALADPHRLAIVDELAFSDRSPSELSESLEIGSNLLAHHLGVLERAGVVERLGSAGDGRRRYLRLALDALAAIAEPVAALVARHVLFVCTANSARSQLAAAAWNARHEVPASSAGTRPSGRVRP